MTKRAVVPTEVLDQRYGKLVVTAVAGQWATCTCDCGNVRRAHTTGLRNGKTKGCRSCMRGKGGSLQAAAATMRRAHAHQYQAIKLWLDGLGVAHQFEWVVGDFIFDLAIFADHLLIEFDGPAHQDPSAAARDKAKDAHAAACGWRVIRFQVQPGAIYDTSLLRSVMPPDGFTPGGAVPAPRTIAPAAQRFVDTLKAAGRPMSAPDVYAASGESRMVWLGHVQRLLALGLVRRPSRGVYEAT